MQKIKSIALICLVITCTVLSACVELASSEPDIGQEPHTAPLPPQAEPKGINLSDGINMLTGLPEKQNEKEKRPLAVMIDNVKAALPQRGISEADIVYEMVTESGITRLMALFSDYEALPPTGPVRSARDQHVKLMLPFNSLFLQIGSSTYAAELLETYKYDSFSINGLYQPGAVFLDSDRARNTLIEHCWFTNGEDFAASAEEYGLKTNNDCIYSAFKFAKEPRVLSGEDALEVTVRFSSYVTSMFQYSQADEKYYKSQFGKPHIDENNGAQLAFDNVLILFTDITKYPDGMLAKVRFEHGGVGTYFSRGKAEQIRWAKTADNEPLLILSADGTEKHVEINKGKSYVAMVDLSMYEHFKITDEPILPAIDEDENPKDESESNPNAQSVSTAPES